MTSKDGWRRSRHSTNSANCVEVFHTLAVVRDSKNVDGPVLRVLRDEMTAFVRAVKEGQIHA